MACAPNAKTEDGFGANSPFTTALLKHIATPELYIDDLFRKVRTEVLDATRDRQNPWSNHNLRWKEGKVYSLC